MRIPLLLVVALGFASVARAQQAPSVVLLTDSNGFVHDVVKPTGGDSVVKRTIESIVKGRLGGTLVHTDDAATLTPEMLDPARTQVLVMYTTGDLPLDTAALVRYVEGGGTLLGIHCATDTFKEDPAFYDLIGGTFVEHPWNADTPVVLKSVDDHPAVTPIGGRRALKEEIYLHSNFVPANVRVLMVLDMEQTAMKRGQLVPVVWVRQVGKGRVLYTSLGHNGAVWRSDWYQAHLAESMKWLLGQVEGPAEPNPAVSEREEGLARAAAQSAGQRPDQERRQRQEEEDKPADLTAATTGGPFSNFNRTPSPPRSQIMIIPTCTLLLPAFLAAPPAAPAEAQASCGVELKLVLAADGPELKVQVVLADAAASQARDGGGRRLEGQGGGAQPDAEGFVPLFDGTAESAKKHWRGFKKQELPEAWAVEDGTLTLKGQSAGDIVTRETYGDFELRLEWKVAEGGNSGIMYRVSETGEGTDATYLTGPEMQVLDDERHPDGKSPLTRAGSLYGLYPVPEPSPVKPAGEWNEARLVVKGNHVEHWLNGEKVAETEIGSEDWKERLAKSKFATWPRFAREKEGHIALQDHGDPVWYRNIRIKRLGGESGEGASQREQRGGTERR